jgi:hypothetical protein
MNFLAPAFLAGLAALSVPVIIHMIHRERKTVVEFPSLMFLQRIPYRSVRRQKIRHLLLLVLRCLALALLVAAFARPFFERRRQISGGTTGAREVVVLLDRSSSMGYADRWRRAQDAARRAIGGLSATDRGTLVLFASDAAVASEPMAPADRITAAINAAKLSSEGTRYGPALKLASQIVTASSLPRREVVVVSDFQKVGWAKHDEVVFPPGVKITPMDIGGGPTPDVAVSTVTTDRGAAGEREQATVAARLTNVGAEAKTVSATLEIGGRRVESKTVTVAASGAQQVIFSPLNVPSGATRGSVRITADQLTQDDVLHFTIAPDEAVSVLLVEPTSPRANQSLYFSRALAIGGKPSFRVDVKRIDALTTADLDRRALVVLDEVTPPAGTVGARMRSMIESGGGVLIVPGDQRPESWSAEWRTLLPASLGNVVDRSGDAGGTLSSIDYAHPIFELFNAPRSGDFSTARFYRYRALNTRGDTGVIARFDDGAAALVERRVGAGKVVLWASTLDKWWTNLPLQPVFLPFVHQLARHAGRYADPRPWFVAGDVLDLSRHGELTALFTTGRAQMDSASQLTLESPSGDRQRVAASGPTHLVTLREQGFYELRGRDTPVGSGRPIAVNVDPTEADLSHMDPQDLIAAVTASSAQKEVASDLNAPTPESQEQRQKLWWYLLLGALLLMAVETAMSNRLSRTAS